MLGKSAVVKAGRGPEGWRGAVRQPRPLRHAAPGLLTRDVLIMQRTLAPSNVDGGVEEGAEGDAVAAFPALPIEEGGSSSFSYSILLKVPSPIRSY